MSAERSPDVVRARGPRSAEVARARAALAAMVRYGRTEEEITIAREALTTARWEQTYPEAIATAPRLTDAQIGRLSRQLFGVR